MYSTYSTCMFKCRYSVLVTSLCHAKYLTYKHCADLDSCYVLALVGDSFGI